MDDPAMNKKTRIKTNHGTNRATNMPGAYSAPHANTIHTFV
jgi:hypothetical protein